MKRIVLLVVLVLIIAIGAVFASMKSWRSTMIALPSASIHPTTVASSSDYCSLAELDGVVKSEGAAGTVYENLTIKNVSSRMCQILGNNFVQPVFSATSVSAPSEGKAGNEVLVLEPGQMVYSVAHYPNGPQCSSGVEQSDVSFMYRTSPNEAIVFHDEDKKTLLRINICKDVNEKTPITVRGLNLSSNQ